MYKKLKFYKELCTFGYFVKNSGRTQHEFQQKNKFLLKKI